MFGRCKPSFSAAARDKGDGLDLDLRRLCAGEATCARKRLASDDPRAAAMRRLRSMFSAAMRPKIPWASGGRTEMAVGFNSRPKEWSRPPEPHPPYTGCWCSRNKRRPYVSLIWCSTPSGHGNRLRPWIQTSGRRTANEPVNLILGFEHAHVTGHSCIFMARQGIAILV